MRFFEINAVATSVERCGEGNDGCKKSKKSKKSAECRVALRSRGGGLTSHKCQAREGNMFIKNTSATNIPSFIGAQAFATCTYHEMNRFPALVVYHLRKSGFKRQEKKKVQGQSC